MWWSGKYNMSVSKTFSFQNIIDFFFFYEQIAGGEKCHLFHSAFMRAFSFNVGTTSTLHSAINRWATAESDQWLLDFTGNLLWEQ